MDCLFVGQHIIELSSIDSTNNYLIDLSQNISLDEGTVVVAKEQKAGKGQRNNRWSSEAGKSLCISILLKPKLDVSQQFLFSQYFDFATCFDLLVKHYMSLVKNYICLVNIWIS